MNTMRRIIDMLDESKRQILMPLPKLPAKMYHTAPHDRLESIRKLGLQTNSPEACEMGNWADEIYGCRPVYLFTEYERKPSSKGIWFEVDVSGLHLAPDLPGLEYDICCIAGIDNNGVEFDNNSLLPVELHGKFVPMSLLLKHNSRENILCILANKTCVSLNSIQPDKIVVISD